MLEWPVFIFWIDRRTVRLLRHFDGADGAELQYRAGRAAGTEKPEWPEWPDPGAATGGFTIFGRQYHTVVLIAFRF